jgi:hypothetical protein
VFTPAHLTIAGVGSLSKARVTELRRVVRDWA